MCCDHPWLSCLKRDWQKKFILGVLSIAFFTIVWLLLKLHGPGHPLSTHQVLVTSHLVKWEESVLLPSSLGERGISVWAGLVLLFSSAFTSVWEHYWVHPVS